MQARSRPLARVSRTVAAAPAGLLRATAVRTVHADGAAGASARRSSGFGVVIAGGAVAASAAVLVAGGLPTTRGAEHTPEAVPEAASMGMDTPEVARVMQKRAQITKIESNAVVFSEYHVNSVAANKNLEDRFATSIVSTADFGNHGLFGVYDGHSGSAAADWVQDHLIDYIRYSMLMVRNGTASDGEAASFVAPAGSVPDANGNGPDGVNTNDGSGADGVPADLVTTLDGPHRAVEYAIRRAFLQCDRVFLQTALADPETQKAGLSGAPAVMAYITGRHLYVAGSGDCRAILIRRNPDTGAVSAEALSIDHHGRVPSEVNRIRSAHKDEWDAIFRGRVKGRLQPTRGFGDGVYKDAAFNQLHRNPIASKYTPPYTTADADVIHTELVGDEECLVLATDGLWDFFENDQVASLVEHALTHNKQPDSDANDVNLSTALIGAVLFKAALPLREYSSHPIEFLFSLAARIRRRVYDDTTVMVVRFDRDRIAKMESDNHRETLLAAGTEDETTEGIAAAVAAHCR